MTPNVQSEGDTDSVKQLRRRLNPAYGRSAVSPQVCEAPVDILAPASNVQTYMSNPNANAPNVSSAVPPSEPGGHEADSGPPEAAMTSM